MLFKLFCLSIDKRKNQPFRNENIQVEIEISQKGLYFYFVNDRGNSRHVTLVYYPIKVTRYLVHFLFSITASRKMWGMEEKSIGIILKYFYLLMY